MVVRRRAFARPGSSAKSPYRVVSSAMAIAEDCAKQCDGLRLFWRRVRSFEAWEIFISVSLDWGSNGIFLGGEDRPGVDCTVTRPSIACFFLKSLDSPIQRTGVIWFNPPHFDSGLRRVVRSC